jgi:hypothetical protein
MVPVFSHQALNTKNQQDSRKTTPENIGGFTKNY